MIKVIEEVYVKLPDLKVLNLSPLLHLTQPL